MDNEIFITKTGGTDILVLAVGSYGRKRRAYLTDDEALRLAYRLMALAKGGETQGIEHFQREN